MESSRKSGIVLCDCLGSEKAVRESAALNAAAASVQARLACGQLLFLELLFWKNARTAADVRDEYDWRVRLPRRTRDDRMCRPFG